MPLCSREPYEAAWYGFKRRTSPSKTYLKPVVNFRCLTWYSTLFFIIAFAYVVNNNCGAVRWRCLVFRNYDPVCCLRVASAEDIAIVAG